MRLPLALALAVATSAAAAETALVAVATNFRPAAEALARTFTNETGHEIRLSAGATGKLAAQIVNGAPFDLFLSADAETPERLAEGGHAIDDSRITYATGSLVLWSADPSRDPSDPGAALRGATHIAIANPALAPYGKAAVQVIEKLELTDVVADHIVMGENVGQAHALAASGAAELGFVAASAITDGTGAGWPVPAHLHDPIRQDAVLLRHGSGNAAARAFLAFLQSESARETIRGFGYGTAP